MFFVFFPSSSSPSFSPTLALLRESHTVVRPHRLPPHPPMTDPAKAAPAVGKAPLLLTPVAAQCPALVHYLKYKLYEKGFIIVREAQQLLNPELAEKLSITLDYVPPYLQEPCATTAAIAGPSASDLVGTCYLFVLAREGCHATLLAFLEELLQDAEYTDLLRELAPSSAPAAGAPSADAPDGGRIAAAPLWRNDFVFVNRTAAGARQAVALLFPQMLPEDIPTHVQSREYVQSALKSALLPALTLLAKTKPAEPLRWLAEYLLANKDAAPESLPTDAGQLQ
ncbi:nucleoside-diphosphate kinase [Strigomonas culicis]|uniref:Nucleoside-diphosphate kinase n=1 Tax=Strigomonas culicis TaxID=28005 RepID=S9U5H5_9TRYP|nr:nucleoside-diphosphate kinase [Strigomonas culicis]|eukprot:EPY26042.1 nucleoside-diphosphate kinase [Strigomonas culicis]